MTVSMFPTLTFADDPLPAAEDEYQVQVELSKPANEVTVGEAVTITATVTRNGEEITDLEAARTGFVVLARRMDTGIYRR